MVMFAEPQPKAQAVQEMEPKAIYFIGGPRHGKSIADTGHDEVRWDGHVYFRKSIVLKKQSFQFDVLAYFGRLEDLKIGAE